MNSAVITIETLIKEKPQYPYKTTKLKIRWLSKCTHKHQRRQDKPLQDIPVRHNLLWVHLQQLAFPGLYKRNKRNSNNIWYIHIYKNIYNNKIYKSHKNEISHEGPNSGMISWRLYREISSLLSWQRSWRQKIQARKDRLIFKMIRIANLEAEYQWMCYIVQH